MCSVRRFFLRWGRCPAPVYTTLSDSGPDHKKSFVRGCYIGDELYGEGVGKNQKIADALAAEAALARLIAEEREQKSKPDYTERLRTMCAERHAPPPSYKDLGETERSSEKEREFLSKCTALGHTVSAVGKSKKDAKTKAASLILELTEKR